MNTNMVSPHHHMALSLRSPQHLAVRPLTEAAHQATGAHCFLQATGLSVLPPPSQPLSAICYEKRKMNTKDQARSHAIYHLTATVASQRIGDYHSIGSGYDEYDQMLSREGLLNNDLLMITLEFWASWADCAAHDWRNYPGMGKDDWPSLADTLIEDLKANRAVTDKILLQHFVNQPPKQRRSIMTRIRKALHGEKPHNQAL